MTAFFKSIFRTLPRIAGAFMALTLSWQAGQVQAVGTFTAAVPITAVVTPNCSVANPSNLAFGTLSGGPSFVALTYAQSSILVTCTGGSSYTLTVDTGQNASGAQLNMRLGTTSNYLMYGVYTDTTYGTPFPTSGGTSVTQVNNGTTGTTVYGRVPAQPVTSVGAYTDQLTFTLTF